MITVELSLTSIRHGQTYELDSGVILTNSVTVVP